MILYTIGFGKKNAETFFNLLRYHQVELLVDVRLNNRSQLAGFTKDGDIQFFLKELCGIQYTHAIDLAPTKELLSGYQAKQISWSEYVEIFSKLMENRGSCKRFANEYRAYERICLLCSEPTPEKCHRRLVAEMVSGENPDAVQIVHL